MEPGRTPSTRTRTLPSVLQGFDLSTEGSVSRPAGLSSPAPGEAEEQELERIMEERFIRHPGQSQEFLDRMVKEMMPMELEEVAEEEEPPGLLAHVDGVDEEEEEELKDEGEYDIQLNLREEERVEMVELGMQAEQEGDTEETPAPVEKDPVIEVQVEVERDRVSEEVRRVVGDVQRIVERVEVNEVAAGGMAAARRGGEAGGCRRGKRQGRRRGWGRGGAPGRQEGCMAGRGVAGRPRRRRSRAPALPAAWRPAPLLPDATTVPVLPSLEEVFSTNIPTHKFPPKAVRGDLARVLNTLWGQLADRPDQEHIWTLDFMFWKVILRADRGPKIGDALSFTRTIMGRLHKWRAGEFTELWEEAVRSVVPQPRRRGRPRRQVEEVDELTQLRTRNANKALAQEGQYTRATKAFQPP